MNIVNIIKLCEENDNIRVLLVFPSGDEAEDGYRRILKAVPLGTFSNLWKAFKSRGEWWCTDNSSSIVFQSRVVLPPDVQYGPEVKLALFHVGCTQEDAEHFVRELHTKSNIWFDILPSSDEIRARGHV